MDLAVMLGLDAGFRRLVRERVESSRHVLFHDLVPVPALEKFLIGITGQADAAAQALTSAREKA